MARLRIADLGPLEGPVLVCGGPYSNLQATRALCDLADAAGIPTGRRICTGDAVAYGADPLATAREVMARGGTLVAGNCERQLAEAAGDCGCGFDEGSACEVLARGWYARAAAALGDAPDIVSAFAACPDIAVFRHAGRRCAVIHGGVTDIARFLWPSSPEAAFAEEIAALTAAVGQVERVIAGHCGIAFHRRIGGVDWINPGAIGLPPHDGRPATRYAVLDGGAGVRFERLDYDHAAASAALAAVEGGAAGYAGALASGLWPSEEVLPPELRRAG